MRTPDLKTTTVLASLLLWLVSCEYDRIDETIDCSVDPVTLEIQSATNTACGLTTGSISFSASGGSEMYEYSLNDRDFEDVSSFDNLASGLYTVTVRDITTGCTDEEQIEIANENGLTITEVQIENTSCDVASGSITIQQENGVAPITYVLNDTLVQAENEFLNLEAGIYNVTVSDADGCEVGLNDLEIATDISLENDIMPIISANCAIPGCHNGSQSPNLTTIESIIDRSGRIQARTSAGTMPPSGPLPQEQINAINCWVENGAQNN